MPKIKFTVARLATHSCPDGKSQAFLWDSTAPGLGLRITTAGAKSYIFQGKIHGGTVRVTIGDPKVWAIDAAQAEARRLKTLLDAGVDPREQVAEQRAAHVARKAEARRQDVTLADAWAVYIEARRSKWSDLHFRDHVDLASLGGAPKKRGKGLTAPGPLAKLMSLRLSALTADEVNGWLITEAQVRPARARLAFNLLRVFSTWCDSKVEFRGLIDPQAVSTRLSKDILPKPGAKNDAIQREQLAGWFSAVHQLRNPVMATYLIGLLLTGARREELAELRWEDVDFRWRSLHLKDKVEKKTGRTIPLTPYLSSLLLSLKTLNDTPPTTRRLRTLAVRSETWKPSPNVFFSLTSDEGRLNSPNDAMHRACESAGIPPVTPHGLRRSFSSLSEWIEIPTGIVAQIMGHKPSATAERHYKVRPLDLLRLWHGKLEAWIIEQAGIEFQSVDAPVEQMTS